MCLSCDGYSDEQIKRGIDLAIRTYGWSMSQIEDDLPWSYTIGLGESFGHPELVVLDLKLSAAAELLWAIVSMVEEDGCLDPGELKRLGVSVVPVHPRHLGSELFAQYSWYYDRAPEEGSFLQIIPPDHWFCECHRNSVRRLDTAVLPARPSLNRAERRHRAHRHRQ